ncbi:unnamed protein product, partial [Ectocarpus sp. 4 AP-2014]
VSALRVAWSRTTRKARTLPTTPPPCFAPHYNPFLPHPCHHNGRPNRRSTDRFALRWLRRTATHFWLCSGLPAGLVGRIATTGTRTLLSRIGTGLKSMARAAWWSCVWRITTSE